MKQPSLLLNLVNTLMITAVVVVVAGLMQWLIGSVLIELGYGDVFQRLIAQSMQQDIAYLQQFPFAVQLIGAHVSWWQPMVTHVNTGQSLSFASTDISHALQLLNAIVLLLKIKLVLMILFLPTLLLVNAVMLIDGLVARSLRRYQGARESALRYHTAKWVLKTVLWMCVFVWMVIPVAYSPLSMLLIALLVSAAATREAAKQFKKYL